MIKAGDAGLGGLGHRHERVLKAYEPCKILFQGTENEVVVLSDVLNLGPKHTEEVLSGVTFGTDLSGSKQIWSCATPTHNAVIVLHASFLVWRVVEKTVSNPSVLIDA